MIDPTLLGVIITAVLTIPAGAGLWQYLSTRRDRPLKAKEVENATATSLQTIYAGVLDDLQSEVKRMGQEVASQGTQIKELRNEVHKQSRFIHRLQVALSTAAAWIDDLHHRWDYHRAQDKPPQKPHLNYDYE